MIYYATVSRLHANRGVVAALQGARSIRARRSGCCRKQPLAQPQTVSSSAGIIMFL